MKYSHICTDMDLSGKVDNKVFPVFFGDEGIAAVGAAQLYRREMVFFRRKLH